MSELERALERLDVAWPATPTFTYARRSVRRRLALAALALTCAIAAAFAVPQSRGAILRFFHLRGVTIERVQSLPPAQERALRASLGVPITHVDAERLLTRPFAVRGVPVYRSGIVVSALLPGNVLFSELYNGGDAMVIKKFVGGANGLRSVELGPGVPGYWLPGRHVVYLPPDLPPRYAGNTLVWQRDGITYRLEGRRLTLARATSLARLLR
jgi:hypothetical protein